MNALPHDEVHRMLYDVLNDQQRKMFEENKELDFSLALGEYGRFRVNCFYQSRGQSAVFRLIPNTIYSFQGLGLPKVCAQISKYRKGLVLVTGPTGSGKSTTLAAMIDFINNGRKEHIMTIEDPIEFVHPSKQCQVIQREVGTHVTSFADGVRSAMREDPDVILVGELRDAETISMAMTAAETGHLVLGTLHTTGAVKTIDRIIDALPGELREQTKGFLSMSLKAVITQVLVKTPDGRGRRAILEILVNNRAIAKLITTDQTHQISSQLQMGRDVGMQTMDSALLEAINNKEIDPDDAIRYANDKKKFQRYVTDTDLVPILDIGDQSKV